MALKLSEDKVASMRKAFSLFDSNGDGCIPVSNLRILMCSLGGKPTQSQLKSIISAEKLTAPFNFPRFLDLMSKHLRVEPFDCQLRDTFKVLDKESTGKVATADLRHVLTNIGEKLEAAELDEWIREVEIEEDGNINYGDFIARMVAK